MTAVESKAIADLQNLASRWPPTLMLFSAAGSLAVVPTGYDAETERFEDVVLAWVEGIPNDGGDPD